MSTTGMTSLRDLPPGSHVCWIVDADEDYVRGGTEVLRAAAARGDKPAVFGPDGSAARSALASHAVIEADPRVAFLGGGPLDPEAMFAMFHEQSALARSEGYQRLALVADMDWLLPLRPTAAAVVEFELLLDRHARDLDATIVCAYRRASFETDVMAGAQCVHPVDAGVSDPPSFRIVAADGGAWRLAGEVDAAVAPHFDSAIAAARRTGSGEIDVSSLEFIDVAGLRAIADAGRAGGRIRLVGTRPIVRRSWELAGFAGVAPGVELVA